MTTRDRIAHTRRQFEAETRDHQMTVLHDDGGVYRHLRFQQAGTSIWHFDLITWPGHLVICGDIGSWHFARLHDMFEFFGTRQTLSPDYWGEKLQGNQRHTGYSAERFRDHVFTAFWETRHEREQNAPLWRAIRDSVLIHDDNEHDAREAVRDFEFTGDQPADDFEFHDAWEWSLNDFDHHYLLALHAIVWGIRQYRAATEPAETVAAAAPADWGVVNA
ncbi:hypothetical protein PBI_JACE_43 [Gordonia phage Jace]|uniref:Uncharacterized protein n=1 Tax=Gordonia phage Jace TaxID=2182360 RepID=A0A2U8UJ69_9CAUD|nr:hypothetical protein HOT28_gp43 [Gordonia phage Jace]AWN03663.1 hypothetical protein PBI_JACE_43 [Gordonia phage Jace]